MPILNLSKLTSEQIDEVQIEEASEGLSFGRRFKLKGDNPELFVFIDIFEEVKNLAETAKNDPKKLAAVSKLVGRLKKANADANANYEIKSFFYHCFTYISRLFGSGPHTKRLEDLQNTIDGQIRTLPPSERLTALKNLPSGGQKDLGLAKLAQEFFDSKDYDHCLEALNEQSYLDITIAKDLIAKTVKIYLTNDEPEKALKTIKPIKGTDKDTLIAKVADYYFIREKFEKVSETMKLSSNQHDKDNFTGKIANFYFDHGEYEKAAETINLVQSLIYLPTLLIKNILDKYIEDKKYEKALDLLPDYRNSKLDYAVKIGNLCCEDNDFENAHKAIELVHKQGYLHPKEKQASEALIKRVVTHYCEGENKQPEKAYEIVEPIKVDGYSREDCAPKNDLLKEIADAYIAKDQLQEALTTSDKIEQDFKMVNEIIMNVAEAYYDKNEPQRALLTIGKCNGMHFTKEIARRVQKYQNAIQ
jgi:hypothetical protein